MLDWLKLCVMGFAPSWTLITSTGLYRRLLFDSKSHSSSAFDCTINLVMKRDHTYIANLLSTQLL